MELKTKTTETIRNSLLSDYSEFFEEPDSTALFVQNKNKPAQMKGVEKMGLKDLAASLVKKGAPLLGSVIGGPVGGKVGQLVASAFGADPDDPDDVIAKIEADPEAAIKLRELETKHRERLEELKLEEARIALTEKSIYLADAQSARDREKAIVRTTGKKDINLYVLAWVVVGGFFILTGILMFKGIGSNPVLDILFGGLVSGFATVLGYFFGSSKGSSDKTHLLSLQQPVKKG